MRRLAMLPETALALALASCWQVCSATAGPAGITDVAISGRNLLAMHEACSGQYGIGAHPCRSVELMRATQAGAVIAPSPGAFVLPSVIGVGGFQPVDATGIAAGGGSPSCLVLTVPSVDASATLEAGNCNLRLPVLCCATFGDALFKDSFESNGGLP